MENEGFSIRGRGTGFSRFSSGIGLENKKSGPSRFHKSLAERSFLRRLYTGQRSVENCPIPNTRTTFLIVFSPDGTKFASTNGNHNVYVVSVTTKAILKTLSGHKRTPWTLAFHPSNNNILASGCLDGEVRVWNLEDNTSEVWLSPGQTVIASLSFHPKVKILMIATYKDLYFWDWSTSIVVSRTTTENEEEKIRYAKFDSSGDKLITAIALKSRILSHSDAISFREIYQFTRGKNTLRDFQHIYKFLKTQLKNYRSIETSTDFTNNVAKPTFSDLEIPFLCTFHYHSFQNCLNVNSFCPYEFSMKVLKILGSNSITKEDLSELCYLCRYTWLYKAVFKCCLLFNKKNHKCRESSNGQNKEHAWNLTENRKRELTAENEDETSGLTENVFRHCFEQYARLIIAPYFASCIPSSVSAKCLDVNELPAYPSDAHCSSSNGERAYYHDVALRSDCFLNLCQKYNFEPRGNFTAFLISSAEVYQFLASLQQISTKADQLKLNAIMTDWEYLYCKMLLICHVIEGDNKLLFRKRPDCVQTRENFSNSEDWQCAISNDLNMNKYSRGYKIQQFVNRNEKTTEKQVGNSSERKSECDLCKPFEEGNTTNTSESMKSLKKELDSMAVTISYLYNAKTQRSRIETLYGSQLDHVFDRKGAARIQTIQTVKKCILTFLSISISELKKLLKSNSMIFSLIDPRFRGTFVRMLVFITKKMISFSNILLDFISKFDYNVSELMNEMDPEYFKMNRERFFFTSHNRHETIHCFDTEDDPIFDEEYTTVTSDLSDDELSSNAPFGFQMKHDEYYSRSANSSLYGTFNSSELDARTRQVSEMFNSAEFQARIRPMARQIAESFRPTEADLRTRIKSDVVCSAIHLTKHLRLLDMWDTVSRQGSQVRNRRPHSRDLFILTNVDVLYNYFRHQTLIVDDDGESSFRASRYHPLHRLQMWDFSKLEVPNISSRTENVIITECKVHNDATVAISHDDTRIAVLLSTNQFCQPDWLGIFSIEWKTLGHILCAVSLNQTAVSLSFSPTNEYLAVGYNYTYLEDIKMADVIAVKEETSTWRNLDKPTKSLPIVTSVIGVPIFDRCYISTTVNCIKWLPAPGRGLVLGTSAGEIKFFC